MNLAKVFSKTIITSPERQQEADSDLTIVKQVQAGDVAAFDQLILKYRERVFGVIYNLTSNREDASD
jgi:RNA polymerase sigma-70 factor (ECF subfamily)